MLSKGELEELKMVVRSSLTVPYTFKHNLQSFSDIVEKSGMFEDVVALEHGSTHNDRLFFYDTTGGSRTSCYMGWFYSYIDEQGQVLAPCDSVGSCVAGNIYERSFKDIWFNNQYLHDTLKEASAGIQTDMPRWKECRHCSYRAVNKFFYEKIKPMSSS